MVKEIIDNDDRCFKCEECSFEYSDKEWAEKCEAWCKEHHTCNMEITQHAIESSGAQVSNQAHGIKSANQLNKNQTT